MPEIGPILRSLGLFVVAGVCEIAGGGILVLYGIIPTLQASHFGRVYAVYGGFFIVLSLLWGWGVDGNKPDRADVIGAAIALVGVCVMMYAPRPSP